MNRAALFTLLIAFAVVAAPLHAQRGAVRISAGQISAATSHGQRGFRAGSFSRHSHRRQFRRPDSVFVPFFYDNPYEYEEPYDDEVTNTAVPIVLRSDAPEPSPKPVVPPKVIEVPGVTGSEVSKAQMPSVFVLTNGQRLESHRYMLTADNLHVTIDRQELTIPVSDLDIKATLTANRERGIELRIPFARNEISLSF